MHDVLTGRYAAVGGKTADLVVDEARAPVVRRIFELTDEGLKAVPPSSAP
jgi:hypothetical protein